MGGLLPQEYLYYSEHTVALGQGELTLKLCTEKHLLCSSILYSCAHQQHMQEKPDDFCSDDTNTLTYRTNRSESGLHP